MPIKDPERRREQARNAARRRKAAKPEEVLAKQREAMRKWRANNLEKSRASVREWREKNPEKAKAIEARRMADPVRWAAKLAYQRERQRAFCKSNPRAALNLKLKYAFGITLEVYESIEKEQRCVCAICGRPETDTFRSKVRRLSVDHCHATGNVRGLLCANCNRGLGLLGDDPERLARAIAYLADPPAKKVLGLA